MHGYRGRLTALRQACQELPECSSEVHLQGAVHRTPVLYPGLQCSASSGEITPCYHPSHLQA